MQLLFHIFQADHLSQKKYYTSWTEYKIDNNVIKDAGNWFENFTQNAKEITYS